jgi:ATP-binding cassette, subfamily A (ABC1), member 3
MKTIGSLIGYCPQFDALLENLTAREHLELYAAIKGIPASLRPKLIENKLQQLNLKQYENVLAGTYSGGNKRKLSVAIALLGNPPIILLDEPSSGMDPEARRFMWSIVSQISTQNKTSSVILTTHSMEEAEALSSKLAIMVEGKVKCIGPVQQLKSKYGKGFEIEVKIRLPTNSEIEASKNRLGDHEDRVHSQEQAVAVLSKLGFKNPEYEFCPSGKCNHFMLQVRSAHAARTWLRHLAVHHD